MLFRPLLILILVNLIFPFQAMAECDDPIYTVINADGSRSIRMVITDPDEPYSFNGVIPSRNFTVVNNESKVFEKIIKTKLQSHTACLVNIDEVHILADNVLFQYNSKIDLGGRKLLITARNVTIENGVEFRGTSAITVHANSLSMSSNTHMIRHIKTSSWAENIRTDKSANDYPPSALIKSYLSLANYMFDLENVKLLDSTYEIYRAIIDNTDSHLNNQIATILTKSAISGRRDTSGLDTATQILILDNEIAPSLMEAQQNLTFLKMGLNRRGIKSNFLHKSQIEQIMGCSVNPTGAGASSNCECFDITLLNKKRIEAGLKINSEFFPKSLANGLLTGCQKTYLAKDILALSVPHYDLDSMIQRFETYLGHLRILTQRRTESISQNQQSLEKEKRKNLLIERNQLLESEALENIRLLEQQIIQLKNQMLRSEKAIVHYHNLLIKHEEYLNILKTLPTQSADSNAMRDIGGFFGSTLSGAGGGASIGGPYGAAFGAVLGAAGWMGNKQYEEDQKAISEEINRINKQLRTVMAEQQIQTYAFNLADTIDSLVELRSKIQSTHINIRKYKMQIAQVKKENEEYEEEVFGLWGHLDNESKFIDILIDHRVKQLKTEWKDIVSRLQMILNTPLFGDNGKSLKVADFDFRACEIGYDAEMKYYSRFETCFHDLKAARSRLKEITINQNQKFLIADVTGANHGQAAKSIIFSKTSLPEEFHKLNKGDLNKVNSIDLPFFVSQEYLPGEKFAFPSSRRNIRIENIEVFYIQAESAPLCEFEMADLKEIDPFIFQFGSIESVYTTDKKKYYFDTSARSDYVTQGIDFRQIPTLAGSGLTYGAEDYDSLSAILKAFSRRFSPEILMRSPLTQIKLVMDPRVKNCFEEIKLVVLYRYDTVTSGGRSEKMCIDKNAEVCE